VVVVVRDGEIAGGVHRDAVRPVEARGGARPVDEGAVSRTCQGRDGSRHDETSAVREIASAGRSDGRTRTPREYVRSRPFLERSAGGTSPGG
jgi:hypothetical protein